MNPPTTNQEYRSERSFGITLGCLFLLIGLYPVIRHGSSPWVWALLVGGTLLGLGLIRPTLLYWPNRLWMAAGRSLGWFNMRLLLVLIYFLLAVPIGLFRRLLGHDPLLLKKSIEASRLRSRRSPPPPDHMNNQF